MAPRIIKRGVVEFLLFEKSIQVVSRHGSPTIFLGRKPDEHTVGMLCDVLDMGAAMQVEHFQYALKPRKMPRV